MFIQTIAAAVAVGSTLVSGAALLPRVRYTTTDIAARAGWSYPAPRALEAATQDLLDTAMQTGPCGEGSVLNRTNYPLTDGQFSIHIYHASYDVEFSYTTDAVPTSSSTFNKWNTLNNGGLIGQICLATPDFDTADSFAVGQDLTFQMKYTSGDTNATFYQCADVTLTAAADAVAFSYCYNATESEAVASADAAATTTAAWTGYTHATTTDESAAAGSSSTGAAAASASASATTPAAAATGGAGRTVAVGGMGAFAWGVAALLL